MAAVPFCERVLPLRAIMIAQACMWMYFKEVQAKRQQQGPLSLIFQSVLRRHISFGPFLGIYQDQMHSSHTVAQSCKMLPSCRLEQPGTRGPNCAQSLAVPRGHCCHLCVHQPGSAAGGGGTGVWRSGPVPLVGRSWHRTPENHIPAGVGL